MLGKILLIMIFGIIKQPYYQCGVSYMPTLKKKKKEFCKKGPNSDSNMLQKTMHSG